MPSKWEQTKSDGATYIKYDLGLKLEQASVVSDLLNAAARAYHVQFKGIWNAFYMEKYADALATILITHRGITNRLFRTGDQPIVLLAKRATELLPQKLEAKRAQKGSS